MNLAYRVFIVTLTLFALVFTSTAQSTDKSKRSEKDTRNTAPTVGTGGPVGGPTGLFTVYDGQTLRRGEYTFSAALSNYDRDPGNVDITEVPISFQVGLSNNFELFFNTDAYRGVKVNNPELLSSFYLPNSRIRGISPAAIVSAPLGWGPGYAGAPAFRPAGSQGFSQFPFTGIGIGGGNGGSTVFPGVGSVYGSILPGIVLQTVTVTPQGGIPTTVPSVYTTAPTYLPDAPFINRTWATSSFNTYTAGGKWRWTDVNNPVGFGVIGAYRWYQDDNFYNDGADTLGGFNQLQRGASPGGDRGDFLVTLFADARLARWANVSGNVGYHWNSSVKSTLGGSSEYTLLDRPDELLMSAALDFPVNKYFQPILEFRSLRYMGGRTPNALEKHPMDAIAGFRVYPTRWFGLGFAYRYNVNQEDGDDFDGFNTSALVFCPEGGVDGKGCSTLPVSNSFTGRPPGFRSSTDPHGYIVQTWIGRRNKRLEDKINQWANVTALNLSDTTIKLPCAPGTHSEEVCNDSTTINVSTTAVDPENDVLTYNYTVSGGRIVGEGANVQWDLSGLGKGSYTITAGVNDGCGLCGETKTQTVTIEDCTGCKQICDCHTLSVTGPAGLTEPGDVMTFTANVSGGETTPTYNWTVSRGTIESGQGTASIRVRTATEDAGTSITATVDLGGFDASCGCPSTDSETGIVADRATPVLVDEYGKLQADDVRARLDAFFLTLQNNPTNQGYVINYGTDREIAAAERLINNHIAFRRFDRSRITLVRGGNTGEGAKTKLYRIPVGAENPAP